MADGMEDKLMALEVRDGSQVVRLCEGKSFGAQHSIAGELVFSTGMVGYEESITDPSYRGQILVMTYPLIGNYGVPSREERDPLLKDLPAHFEASEIHIAGLIVASYCGEDYSHHLATSSLGKWLKEQNIPAICGVDTRALTKRIRQKGSMLGRLRLQIGDMVDGMAALGIPIPRGPLLTPNGLTNGFNLNGESGYNTPLARTEYEEIAWSDPNTQNLVADGKSIVPCCRYIRVSDAFIVSTFSPKVYSPEPSTALKHPSGRPVKVVCVDVGLKYNQIRCLVARGVEVEVVPWDYDFPKLAGKEYDGLFISNGPGDPAMMAQTVDHIRTAMNEARMPIFGICLGHQLLARAAGADTLKMKFGNRGHNIPCTNLLSGKCYITSRQY